VPGLLVVSLAVLLVAAAPRASSRTPLTAGFTTDREIRGGEVHAYPVNLRAGQFLRVSVQEKGIDLVVRLTNSADKDLTGVDSVTGGEAKEDLAFVAPAKGTYELKVSAGKDTGAGRYVLKVGALGKPGGKDRLRADAVHATWAGFQTPGMTAEDRVRAFENALALWQQLGDARQTAEVLFYLGHMKKEALSMFDLAAADFRRSAALLEQQPDRGAKKLRAFALTELGRSLSGAGHRAEARVVHERALAQARAIKDPEFQATNLMILGKSDIADGEVKKGFDRLQKALPLARQAKKGQTEAVILNELAVAYEHRSEMQKALDSYEQALKIALARKDLAAEVIYTNNSGEAHRYLGDWNTAFDRFRRAAKLSEQYPKNRGEILINLACAHQHLGQLEQARRAFDEALDLGKKNRSQKVQCFALANRALLRLQVRRPVEALADARKAVELSDSLETENFSRFVLGKALREVGNKVAAQEELNKALVLARKRGAQGTEAEIDLALAHLAREQGELSAARTHLESAIDLIESRRGRVVDPELRTSFLASKQDYYELEIDTLMALHQRQPGTGMAAHALQESERARARGLLEILNEADADVRRGADPRLLEKERQLRSEVNVRDWQRRNVLAEANPDPGKVTEVERQLKQALEAYQKVQVELLETNPSYAALTQPQPLAVTEIQHRLLEGKALLLEYSLGAERSFLWAVAPGSLQSFELPARDRIEKVARRYYAQLTARNLVVKGEPPLASKQRVRKADAEAEKAAGELSELILRPVQKLLGDRPLLIVAHGALQYIPFAALPIPGIGAPLASRHQILSLPSASVLAVIRRDLRSRSPAPKRLAIFSDPVFQKDDERLLTYLDKARRVRLSQATSPRRGASEDGREAVIDLTKFRRLTASKKEAKTIADLLHLLPPDQVFKAEGFDASRATVMNGELYKYRDVHFATHGVLEAEHPELSGLVLSLYNRRGEFQSDGLLRLNDVYNLRLNADLVVLSACQTALGKEVRGEGLVGLTRGFMYAGAARVLASLWSVEDQATAELMGSFYRGMLRDGLTPAEALRRAQLEIAGKKPVWKSPYYWAGFSLQGEWR
jgi:CHAT domain-containing protein/tetratricopeptide (TPR) repeat protein